MTTLRDIPGVEEIVRKYHPNHAVSLSIFMGQIKEAKPGKMIPIPSWMPVEDGSRLVNLIQEALEKEKSKDASGLETAEFTGKSVNYYKVEVSAPTTEGINPYTAECNDIIEALGMNYAEANTFKAIWRICAARTLGKHKKNNTAVYDAEKAVFFAERVLTQQQNLAKAKSS